MNDKEREGNKFKNLTLMIAMGVWYSMVLYVCLAFFIKTL